MVYEEPVFRTLGDLTVNVELANEDDLFVNFRILAVDAAVRAKSPEGLIETNPQARSLGVIYDPRLLKRDGLIGYLRELLNEIKTVKTLPSRKVFIPAWYDDPWSRDCAKAFGVKNNIEYIAECNNMTVQQVIDTHTNCEHWVTGVGFVPGAFIATPLDPRRRLPVPLYRTPRTWTHSRLLNSGGYCFSIYPIRTPGGGQLFGRTPLNIWEPEQKNAVFKERPVLARAGDRQVYRAITPDEYSDIRRLVEAGTYEYEIEDGVFDVEAYAEWLRTIVPSKSV